MAPRGTKNNAYVYKMCWSNYSCIDIMVCYGIFCTGQFQDGGDIIFLLYLC